MDREQAYEKMAERKSAPKDFGTYIGDNGRVNRCVQMMLKGNINTGGTLIDIGGGIGDLCWAVTNTKPDPLFERAICVDISKKNLEAAASKIGHENIYRVDIDKEGLFDIDNSYANVITALDFIEHIIDPVSFASECFRVLKPGGEVFINTPNIRFFRHIEQLWYSGTFPHTSGDRELFHGGHLAFFTFRDLCHIFRTVGFSDFKMFKDDEGFENPDLKFIDVFKPKSQYEFVNLSTEFGSPNLLFKAVKP